MHYRPSDKFLFQKRNLECGKGSVSRKWFQKFPWLHYNKKNDTLLFYNCMKNDRLNKTNLWSKSMEVAFTRTGFSNWKKCPCWKCLQKHKASCYVDRVALTYIETKNKQPIEAQLSEMKEKEQANNCQFMLQIIQNVQFLSRQGLVFRGNNKEGNFDQLLKRCEQINPRIGAWVEKHKNISIMSTNMN